MGTTVGVDGSDVGETGISVEGDVAVVWIAVRLQEVNITASMTIQKRDFIQSSFRTS
jgi:hypothetical protein